MDLNRFTAEQQQVIRHGVGHTKVSAGPGSGKTSTMVARIQYLLEQGADPTRILVLMFNKSASVGFQSKLEKACGKVPLPQVRTFHSFGMTLCERLVKAGKMRHARLLTDDFQIQGFLRDAFHRSAAQSGVPNDILFNPETFESFQAYVEACKACLDSFDETFRNLKLGPDYRFFIGALRDFEGVRKQEGFRTFSDLLYDPALAMSKDESAVALLRNRADQIVVDEFQDTNPVQMAILIWIAGTRADVCVIGDPDQSIYGWRSSRPEIMLREFDEAFQGATHYSLSRTFRFGHRLALAANNVIVANRERDDRICISDASTPNTTVELMPDTVSVAHLAQKWVASGRQLREITILPRTYSMAAPIELDLLENHIPYRIEGADSVVHSKITEALLAWAMVSVGAMSSQTKIAFRTALAALFSLPPLGLAKTQVEVILSEMVSAPLLVSDILRQAATDARPKAATSCRTRALLWNKIANRRRGDEMAAPLLSLILDESGAEEYFAKSTTTEGASDKLALAAGLVMFCQRKALTIRGFIDLFTDLRNRSTFKEDDSILVTSIHRSKGLEWPLVIVPSMREGQFPPTVPGRTSISNNFEDERRLFFVAITRAQERCVILHPEDPELSASGDRGRAHHAALAPTSRFVYEACVPLANRIADALETPTPVPIQAEDHQVSNRYLEVIDSSLRVQPSAQASTPKGRDKSSPFSDPTKKGSPSAIHLFGYDFWAGQLVNHPAFGDGKVVEFIQDGKIIVIGFGPAFQNQKWLQPLTAINTGLRPK